jgi:hypothetical protein
MIFTYNDLKFWLEDADLLPQSYWDALEDYDPDNKNSDEILAKWLGFAHVADFYEYEMQITYVEESYNEDGYTNTTAYPTSNIINPPTKMDMQLYYKWINWATSVAADEY